MLIPGAVHRELSAAGTPLKVSEWLRTRWDWLRIEDVAFEQIATVPQDLDSGEREAIALARFADADILLIDDAAGRAQARGMGQCVTG